MSGMRRSTLAVLGVLLFCSLYDLGGRSLHEFDTARWGQLAREMIRSGEWLVPTRYGELYVNKPPIYLWLVAGPAAVFGEVTPFLVRLPSALGLLLLVLTTWRWTVWRTGSEQAGRLAALLIVSTFGVAWLGRAGRLDMLGAAVSLLAAALLDRAASGQGGRRTPWIVGVLLGVSLLIKGPPLLLVPLAVLFASDGTHTLRQRVRQARPLLALAVGAGVALLWFVPAVMQAGWEAYGHKLLVGQAAERIGGTLDQSKPAWFYLWGLPVYYAPWGPLYLLLAVGAWWPRVRRSLGPTAGLALAGSVLILVFTLVPTKHFRYLVPVVPLFVVPLAAWCVTWLAGPTRAAWTRHARALAGLLACGALGLLVVGGSEAEARLVVLAPAAALAGAAWWAWPRRAEAAAAARRRAVIGALCGVALAVLAVSVVRPRVYESTKEHFNRRLAELRAEDVPVWIGPGLAPENVFHGAPEARFLPDPAAPVPAAADGRRLVVCLRRVAGDLRDASGAAGTILAGRSGPDAWVIVGFGYP